MYEEEPGREMGRGVEVRPVETRSLEAVMVVVGVEERVVRSAESALGTYVSLGVGTMVTFHPPLSLGRCSAVRTL